jgi:hypothetical protein
MFAAAPVLEVMMQQMDHFAIDIKLNGYVVKI